MDNTKDAERELNKRLLNITGHTDEQVDSDKPPENKKAEVAKPSISSNEPEQGFVGDDWLEQAKADVEEWL